MGPIPCPFTRFNLPGGLDVAEQTFISWQREEIPRLVWKRSSWNGRCLSRLKRRPLRGPSYPASQAGKTASTFPFSTGNTLPARSRHGTRLFRNFIMLLPERHLMSPKPSFFLLCHFQACRLQQKFSPRPPTLHHALPHFISFPLFQPKCGNSSCTVF